MNESRGLFPGLIACIGPIGYTAPGGHISSHFCPHQLICCRAVTPFTLSQGVSIKVFLLIYEKLNDCFRASRY